jgi:hypothetical protein
MVVLLLTAFKVQELTPLNVVLEIRAARRRGEGFLAMGQSASG